MRSSHRPWCRADATPIATPMTSQMTAAPTASESVRGMPRTIVGITWV